MGRKLWSVFRRDGHNMNLSLPPRWKAMGRESSWRSQISSSTNLSRCELLGVTYCRDVGYPIKGCRGGGTQIVLISLQCLLFTIYSEYQFHPSGSILVYSISQYPILIYVYYYSLLLYSINSI